MITHYAFNRNLGKRIEATNVGFRFYAVEYERKLFF